jgi:hypothetical protein
MNWKRAQILVGIVCFVLFGFYLTYIACIHNESLSIIQCLIRGFLEASPFLFLPLLLRKAKRKDN